MKNMQSDIESKAHELTDLDGIGDVTAKKLVKVGISSVEVLANLAPARFVEMVDEANLADEDLHLSVKLDKAEVWIENAQKKLGEYEMVEENGRLEEDTAVSNSTNSPDSTESTEPAWQSRFTIHLEYADVDGKRIWQTRPYFDNIFGEDEKIPGIDIKKAMNWIESRLEQLDMNVEKQAVENDLAEVQSSEVVAEEAISLLDVNIEISDVKISEIAPKLNQSLSVPDKYLVVEVDFELVGNDVVKLVENEAPYRMEIKAINHKSKKTNFSDSEEQRFQPGIYSYKSQQLLPVPEIGQYDLLFTIALDSPIICQQEFHGPQIKVVP